MWGINRAHCLSSFPALEPASTSLAKSDLPIRAYDDLSSYSLVEAKIGKGQLVKGKISGSGPLFIDGRVEGEIEIPNERVTIGENGVFVGHPGKDRQFGIIAREIVIMGQVIGSVSASHRVEIRPSGSITGDIETPRLRIADGGFCKGAVNLRKEAPASSLEIPPLPSWPNAQNHVDGWKRGSWTGVAS